MKLLGVVVGIVLSVLAAAQDGYDYSYGYDFYDNGEPRMEISLGSRTHRPPRLQISAVATETTSETATAESLEARRVRTEVQEILEALAVRAASVATTATTTNTATTVSDRMCCCACSRFAPCHHATLKRDVDDVPFPSRR